MDSDQNYFNWSLSNLVSEIGKRRLLLDLLMVATKSFQSLPEDERKGKLVFILNRDDQVLGRYPEIRKYPE